MDVGFMGTPEEGEGRRRLKVGGWEFRCYLWVARVVAFVRV